MSSSYALTLPACVFVHSRLLQGGALSDREEADAIRELEVRFYCMLIVTGMAECMFLGVLLTMDG